MIRKSTDGQKYLISDHPRCGGECLKYKAARPRGKSIKELGLKRCMNCIILMKYDGVKCPCCKNKLRSRPKSSKDRKESEVKRI